MPRTLTDEEYALLVNKAHVANFAESIWNDPGLNKDAQRLAKRKYPNLQIPELDIEDKVQARFDAEDKRRAEEAAERQKQLEDTEWKDKRTAAQKKYGLTDEGLEKLEKFMGERKVLDYDVAASHLINTQPKTSEAEFSADRWQHEKQTGWQDIAKDPEGWGRGEILKAIRNDEERARAQGF
jgi:DNA-binding PadR family transcriptional regulator